MEEPVNLEVAEEELEVADATSTPAIEPDIQVNVAVPEPEPIAVPEMESGEPDQARDMQIGAIRATLDAHLVRYEEDDAEWESRVAGLELAQAEMTTRFSEESQTLRLLIAEAAERPIAEVYLPPEPPPVEEAENPDGEPLASRPLDEAAAAVIAPVRNALGVAPAPERKLRRRHRQR